MLILQGPVDHLRQGFQSYEQAHRAPHPIQMMQNRPDLEWNYKLDTVRRTYGSHMAMRLATEKKVMSRMRRLPGLETSSIGVDTVLGTDLSIEFRDYLNSKSFPPLPLLTSLHSSSHFFFSLSVHSSTQSSHHPQA